MPLLPESAYKSEFFKPDELNLKMGDRKTFVIKGAHEVTVLNKKEVYSMPVELDGKLGKINLGKISAKQFVSKLGPNTDKWINATFDAIVYPVNNPTTGTQTRSWAIDVDTIRFPDSS
jgi:plastocyanin